MLCLYSVACGANCAECASATVCDVCDTVANGTATAGTGVNSCTVACDVGFYTADPTADGATCMGKKELSCSES
jgi:hypothetical protein